MADDGVTLYRFRLRRALKATWQAINDVLLEGELGLSRDTGELKVGNGGGGWNELPYIEHGLRLRRLGDVDDSNMASGRALVWNEALGAHIYADVGGGGGGGGGDRNVTTSVAINSGVAIIDVALGDFFDIELTEDIDDWDFYNVPSGCQLKIRLTQSPNAKTVAWPVNLAWAADVAPAVSTTPAVRDVMILSTFNGGESWTGTYANNADLPAELDLGADIHWDQVQALLRFDSGATSDLTGRVWNSGGAPGLDLANAKWGAGALLLNGSSDIRSANPDFGTADFTIEAWINVSISSGTRAIVQFVDSSGVRWSFYRRSSGGLLALYHSATGQVILGPNIPINQWHHVSWVRRDGAHKLFLNGVGTAGGSPAHETAEIGEGTLYVGQNGSGSEYWQGMMDEFRVTFGVARYWDDFTPPDTPFPGRGP